MKRSVLSMIFIFVLAFAEGDTTSEHIFSAEDAEEIVDGDIEAALASIPAPMSWAGDTYVYNGDTIYTVYGKVSADYLDAAGMSVTYGIRAILVKSNCGYTWVSCSDDGTFVPGSGRYVFVGSCTGSVITTRDLRLVSDGLLTTEDPFIRSILRGRVFKEDESYET